jgi:quinol monooxygenase YgiN
MPIKRMLAWATFAVAALALASAVFGSHPPRQLKKMDQIQGIARLKIHAGKLEEFKRVTSQCMQLVRTKDTGTLQFELYLNGDQTECIVLERYRDLQSLLEHQKNMGGLMGALLKTCTESAVVCGKASPELIKALDGSPVQLFNSYEAL